MSQELELLKGQVENLTKMVEDQQSEISTLKKESNLLRKAASGDVDSVEVVSEKKFVAEFPTVKIGGKNYKFKIPKFNFRGQKYTSTEAANDKDLLKELLEVSPSMFEQL